ncbi:MAG TPA: GreA/GreB family elongation factor [Kiritimatiellia bacterium]|nr:GreA/GreB family elongation factor [Kiritimatiellia bacterium]HMO97578.1 GreA/GreB family elongation factor [Kiritimatiellia bacterium]HMP96775.1 GreA/GreB family elongation factor [Kiritimatiellia bacterium]
MQTRNIILSALDCARLRDVLIAAKQFDSSDSALIRALETEINRATVVEPDEIPPYVVTMNTCVCLIDTATGEEVKYTLVYPSSADPKRGKLSILSDLGVAIIGFAVGDTIAWTFPEGVRSLRIGAIHFQPEATRQYNL